MQSPKLPDRSASVQNLRTLLHYQESSIVSRVLLSSKSGTITLFAFDDGQSLSEHTAPFDALAIVLEGDVEIRISNDSWRLGNSESIILPANEPHAVRALSRLTMLLVMIKA